MGERGLSELPEASQRGGGWGQPWEQRPHKGWEPEPRLCPSLPTPRASASVSNSGEGGRPGGRGGGRRKAPHPAALPLTLESSISPELEEKTRCGLDGRRRRWYWAEELWSLLETLVIRRGR